MICAPGSKVPVDPIEALSRLVQSGFATQTKEVDLFRQQVANLSANFDKMQGEFIENARRQEAKFAEMKALQDAAIHQCVLDSDIIMYEKFNTMFKKFDVTI